jgi:DNA polymerase I
MKTFYLVDASSLFFRAYYAIPPMNNDEGLPTNALYGFLSMIIKILKESKPDYLAFCMDRREPSFRKEIYPEYKANRSEMPEDLALQMPYIDQLIDLMGIHKVSRAGYEADDIIGTLSALGTKEKLETIIVSGDKDFAQLINEHVVMYDSMKDITYDVPGVKAKWGVGPEQFIDYLAIVGDSSDNIPGIKGIGPKGAIKLLDEFGDLESILASVDLVKAPALKKKILENVEMAKLSKTLVTITTDIDLTSEMNNYIPAVIDREKLVELLETLKFKNFEKKIFSEAPISKAKGSSEKSKSKTVSKKKSEVKDIVVWSLDELAENIAPYTKLYSFVMGDEVIFQKEKALFKVNEELSKIGSTLDSKKIVWSGFGVKSIWRKLGLKNDQDINWDSKVAAYVVNPTNIKDFDSLFEKKYSDTMDKEASELDYYNAHMQLKEELETELSEIDEANVYKDIEIPLVKALFEMEKNGVSINSEILNTESEALERDLKEIEVRIYEHAGEEFNILSPKQLGEILFTKLNLTVIKKTKTGFSTNSDVLEKLKSEHEICAEVLYYRELSKLKSTYVDSLPKLVNTETNKIHSEFKQTVTTTGRLSSVNPNLQNIPIRTARGRKVRAAFVASEGCQLLSIDYSQIELRILAHVSNDENMITAFRNNFDIHQSTASEVFGVELEEVTSEQRRQAKAVNFGIAYGQGTYGLAESLNIPRKEAKEIIERYFEQFPGIKSYMDEAIKTAYDQGYVETLWGRKRFITQLKSSNKMIQKFGERAAINAPIQGSASDIIKKAMNEIYDSVDAKMIIQVHDELLFDIPREEVSQLALEIKDIMENIVDLKVPLVVNMAWGDNWEDAHA